MTEQTKVLLGESDRIAAAEILRGMQGQGYAVVSAPDAVQVLAMAKLAKPDVGLINTRLAGGGGLAALKRIRSNIFTTHIPVVMVVGAAGPQEEELLEAGAQECIEWSPSVERACAAVGRHRLESLDFSEAPAEALAAPERLSALRETGLLDSPPEEHYDRLTRLASRLLGAPAALVSLVDKDRQFFKSQVGLREPWASQRQTRLSHSFCQWVVSGKEQVVVSDAKEHPVLRANLAVRDLGVIAYAGVPLEVDSGHIIGSFCAVDTKPHVWSEEDVCTLEDLAKVARAYAGSGSIKVAGDAIVGVTRILQRYGSRLGEPERDDLLAIMQERAAHLR